MSRRPEAVLCEKILRKLRKIPHSYWERVEQVSIRGTADIMGCMCGICYWVEVKMKFKETLEKREKLQLYKMGRIIDAGGAGVLMTTDNWKFHCNRLKKKAQKHQEKLTQS